jgi:hypothetical protein
MFAVPADVLEHHLFSQLPLFSRVCATLVCHKWRKIIAKMPRTYEEDQHGILDSLFKEGPSIEYLLWFERALKYPLWRRRWPSAVLECKGWRTEDLEQLDQQCWWKGVNKRVGLAAAGLRINNSSIRGF